MENLIHIKRCSRLTWSNPSPLITSCLIIISLFISHVNCVETKANLNLTTCLLTVNDNTYNLSSLVRHDGDIPWQLNSNMLRHQIDEHEHIFINLCRPLPKTPPTFTDGGCKRSTNSSVCLVDTAANSTTSLADYNKIEASYDNDTMDAIHLRMRSTNYTVDLYLHCNPSLKNSQPTITSRKLNKLTIEWYDAAGCPKEEVIGENCQVYVPAIGKAFDLSPLHKATGYDFPENGYHYYINVCGPINRNGTGCRQDSGICHYSKSGKMHYSLGKWSDKVSYSDGVLTLSYNGGDPYRNAEKTPRSTRISFICNNSVGDGKPDFVAETNRTYIINWETVHACPKPMRSVDCTWQNSTHRFDLSPFKKSEGNTIVPLRSSIIIINACGPINPKMHGMGDRKCPLSSGVCYISVSSNGKCLNLGQPTEPPKLVDGQINLSYSNGDLCPSNPGTRYATRISFSCDREAGEGFPILIEGGNPNECEWLFEWKTSLVCEARPIFAHKCIFEDSMYGSKVDLTEVFQSDSVRLIPNNQNNSTIQTFFINVCSHGSSMESYKESKMRKNCGNSSICVEESTVLDTESPKYHSLGDLQKSEYFFQGESLILKFYDGSPCGSTKNFSSEINIKCSSGNMTRYLGRDFGECSHLISLESPLVFGLKSSCTYRVNDSLIDLRELSSITHAWRANASSNGKVYYFNLCNKIPENHPAGDEISSVVECDVIDNVENCGHPLGRKDLMSMSMEFNEDKSKKVLIITYKNENTSVCSRITSVTTYIKLVCAAIYREPKFIIKIDNQTHCEYHFEWETYLACFSHEPERLERPLTRIGNYFIDKRSELEINRALNMSEIFNSVYTVSDSNYEYTINLAGNAFNIAGNCINAAICQKEINGTFTRDIGSFDTEVMVTQGSRVKLQLYATNHQKCGKNDRKNVTSTVFFQCGSPESGVGSPRFFYESNDCDYIFLWDTDIVCPSKMLDAAELIAKLENQSNHKSNSFSVMASFFGALVIVLCIIVFVVGPLAWIVYKLSYREKRNYLVHWIRSKFRSPVITSFHYSQVSSDSTKLVSMNDDL